MAHPKRKQSQTRRDKRRTHWKVQEKRYRTCPTTGEVHLSHHAFWHEGKLYHKGAVVWEKESD